MERAELVGRLFPTAGEDEWPRGAWRNALNAEATEQFLEVVQTYLK